MSRKNSAPITYVTEFDFQIKLLHKIKNHSNLFYSCVNAVYSEFIPETDVVGVEMIPGENGTENYSDTIQVSVKANRDIGIRSDVIKSVQAKVAAAHIPAPTGGEFSFCVYGIIDAYGDYMYSVRKDAQDTFCLNGVDKNGNYQSFEDDGCYCYQWAAEHGFEVVHREITMKVD